jgi:hypothetical protein
MMHQCNGRVPLKALLTSPGARISTISSVPFSGGGGAKAHAHGPTSVNSSTFCMGMACKHAARALCNLWCPQHEIGRSMVEDSDAVPWAHGGELPSPVAVAGRGSSLAEGLAYFDRLLAVGTDEAWPRRSKT